MYPSCIILLYYRSNRGEIREWTSRPAVERMEPMKRKLLYGFLTAVLLLYGLSGTVDAVRTIPVQVDGKKLACISYIDSGVTYIPLRSLTDAFGGWSISWDAASKSAVAVRSGGSIQASPNADRMTINGTVYSGSVFIKNGLTYVPLRTVAAACGAAVAWDPAFGGAAVTSPGASYNAVDLYWLSHIISAESQSEPTTGQIAVGNVVLNRVKAAEFPGTVAGVIFDRVDGVQFEPISNGTIYAEPTAQAIAAAKSALDGAKPVGTCQYFFNPARSQGTWIRANRTYYTTIGAHQFYL